MPKRDLFRMSKKARQNLVKDAAERGSAERRLLSREERAKLVWLDARAVVLDTVAILRLKGAPHISDTLDGMSEAYAKQLLYAALVLLLEADPDA